MAIFRCSMFGHIVYDDKFTYQELLDIEARVSAIVLQALEECGAQHIDFTSQADSLLVECVFPELDRDNNHTLCDTIIRQLNPGVLARFLFVDRQLDGTVFYFLGRGKWQEQAFSVPGPREALSGWVVRQERKPAQPRKTEDLAAPPPADPACEEPALEKDGGERLHPAAKPKKRVRKRGVEQA